MQNKPYNVLEIQIIKGVVIVRIGIFTDTYLPDINGVVTSVLTLKKALEKNGHEVFVVTNHDDMLKTTFKDNVLRLPGLKLDFLYGYKLTNPIQIAAAKPIKAWNLDLIHVHQEFGVGIFGRSLASAFEIPLVSTYHTTYEDYTHYVNFFNFETIDNISKRAVEGLSKAFTKKSQIVIAPSEKTKEMLVGYGIKNRIQVIPTGLDLDVFDENNTSVEKIKEIRDECGISEGQSVFIYVGRIAQEKSIDIVIKAFKHVKAKGINAKFVIVGSGPDLKMLQELTKELALEDYVFFAGLKQREEVAAYYHSADAFISGSTTETQGLTYIEALASGLGLFARKDEVLKDIVIEDKTGYYFDNEVQLANKIENFILNRENRARIKENALKVSKAYSLDEYYDNIIECYKQAIEMEKNVTN